MLRAEGLTKVYEDGTVGLDHLDLEVGRGEILCLLGANGAGKTTTINLFLNFIEPSEGRCSINGVDVARDPLKAKRHVAYLSENVMLYSSFTARENLAFFARLAGHRRLVRDDHDQLLARTGLDRPAFDQRVGSFSKGMRQKLGIAIAMAKGAAAMILDEPLSGLDPKAASDLVGILNDLREEGRAILMSTHDIFRARVLADRIAIMKGGRKVMEAGREELAAADLEQMYLDYMGSAEESPAA